MSPKQPDHEFGHLIVGDAGAETVDPVIWLDLCSGGELLEIHHAAEFRLGQALVLACAGAIAGLVMLLSWWVG